MRRLLNILSIMTFAVLAGCGGSGSGGSDNKSTDTIEKKIQASRPLPLKKQTGFTLAVLPDTQKYAQKYPEIFEAQTAWIANNYKKENIKFTVHLGDIVESPRSDKEWNVAVKAMSTLDKNPETPYSILAGNHDLKWLGIFGNDQTRDADEKFLKYFPVEKQKKNFSTFKGADSTGFNSYHIFSDDDDQEYLVLALDWRASDKTIEWAKSVLKKHSGLPAILTTHELLDPRTNTHMPKLTKNGLNLWMKLIRDHDQIFLTLNGHWNGEAYRVEKNIYGNNVLLIVVDYQNFHKGGNGMMQLINFDKVRNRLDIHSYSPHVDIMKFEDKSQYDILERWHFSVGMDFEERFSSFKPR